MRLCVNNAALESGRVGRDLAILAVMVAACAVPFLDQPFHMDDNFYMDMARDAHARPLFAHETPRQFPGRSVPENGGHFRPPMQTYALALLQFCFGEGPGREWKYHSCALAYPLLAVAAFYFICARHVERPLWPSLVLASTPVFLVMQHNLMADIPALAFWLVAICCFVWAVERRRKSLFAASAIFQFAAMFTSWQSLVLTPLLGFYQLRRRGGAAGLAALAAPLAAMGAWFGLSCLQQRRFLLSDAFRFVQSRHPGTLETLGNKLAAVLQYQGWLIIFPFFFLYALARGMRGRLLGLGALGAAYLTQAAVAHYRLVDKAIFLVGLVTGAFVLLSMAAVFRESVRTREAGGSVETQFVALWYFGVLACCLFLFTEGSARHILPLVPPVVLCFFSRLQASEISEYRASSRPLLGSAMVASGSLVLSLAWGLALSHADREFARVYPRAAADFSHVAGGMDSYYIGGWGFGYYFSRAGVMQVPMDESRVKGGSWLVRPRLAAPRDIPAALVSMTMPVQGLAYHPATPLRTLDWRTPAGFYSTSRGLVPFSLSRRALEELEVRQVNFFVERLPWAKVEGGVQESPWPGYLEIQERSPLALLAKPGTRIIYSWTVPGSLTLELLCGISPDAYSENASRVFRLGICQRDARGGVVAGFRKALNPGIEKQDRGWQPVRLLLEGRKQGAETLELRYECDEAGATGTAAFAAAYLRHPS
jgi:hypothetical protein